MLDAVIEPDVVAIRGSLAVLVGFALGGLLGLVLAKGLAPALALLTGLVALANHNSRIAAENGETIRRILWLIVGVLAALAACFTPLLGLTGRFG